MPPLSINPRWPLPQPPFSWLGAGSWGLATGIALFGGLVAATVLTAAPLKLALAALVALAGSLLFFLIPNKRLALVAAWVFIHPLSIEKVFDILPQGPEPFIVPSVVVSASDLLLATLVGWLGLEFFRSKGRMLYWPQALTPFALLCLWVLILFFQHEASAQSILQVLHYTKMLLFLLAVSLAVRTRQELLILMVVVLLVVFLQSLIVGYSYGTKSRVSLLGAAGPELAMSFRSGEQEAITRASGTLGHVNQQAMFGVYFTLPLLALLWVKNSWIRGMAGLTLLASSLALLLGFSRTGWISFGLGMATIFFLAVQNGLLGRRALMSLGGVGLLALALGAGFAKPVYERIFHGGEGAGSSRLRMAETALNHITHHPLTGVGPGRFVEENLSRVDLNKESNAWVRPDQLVAPKRFTGLELYEIPVGDTIKFSPITVHNKFLLILSELGTVGLALFLWFLARLFWHAKGAMRTGDRFLKWLGVSLLGVWVAGLFSYHLELYYDDKTVSLLFFSYALLMALDRLNSLPLAAASQTSS